MSCIVKKDDEFCYVSYKKKKKKHQKQIIASFPLIVPSDPSPNIRAIVTDIQDELRCSNFISYFKEDLLNVLNEWDLGHLLAVDYSNDNLPCKLDSFRTSIETKSIEIICYGLGQFSSCVIARYQLGFLLILKQILHSAHVYIYDPLFSPEEKLFLKELGFNVLNINEEAKRTLKGKSVCFLPHCDLPLYNNLLWANWNLKQLSELVIIGNSFQSYELNDAKGSLKEKAKYVYLANKFITEVRISNVFRFTDIFNDLSLHYFKIGSLSSVDSFMWTDTEEPEYSDGDEVIKGF